MSDLQLALLFPYIPFLGIVIVILFLELLDGSNDEDDDNNHDGGIMQPVYAPVSNPA